MAEANQLESIEALGGLGTADLRSLEVSQRVLDLGKGEWLFMEGDRQCELYGLLHGRIKISRLSRTGKELILELVEPGEIFGERSLFDDGPQEAFAVAFQDSGVVRFKAAELRELMETRPDLALRLAKLVELRSQRMEQRLVGIAFQRVRGRLAGLLLQLCQDYGVRGNDGVRLGIELRHQEMANLIGVSREIVTHTLSDFRRAGLVGTRGRRLIVRQTTPLQQIEALAAW